MSAPAYSISEADGPLVATAIHAGHDLRDEVARLMALDEATRLREEDPYTDGWTAVAGNRVVVHRSRFEVDMNRSSDDAVCYVPEDCWDLEVWRSAAPSDVFARSLQIHARFYFDLHAVLCRLVDRYGGFVLYDLHSYNHRRTGRPADPATNPEINVGTGAMDIERWGGLVERFINSMCAYDFDGRSLDVRENVKFRGGHLSQWVHQTFGAHGCALAIEVKKFFMDEQTGKRDEHLWNEIGRALGATVPAVTGALDLAVSR
jgi:N-formylglutamate amidohydrolase